MSHKLERAHNVAKSASLADYLLESSIDKWSAGPPAHVSNLERYRQGAEGALAFFAEVTGFQPHPYQVDIVHGLYDSKRACVRAPRGSGKSALAANLVLHFSAVNDECKVATTAGTWLQLEEFLWPEIRKWAVNADWSLIGKKPQVNQLDLSFGATAKAFAINADKPELMEGAHAANVLFVFDEAKVIADAVFDAVEGTLSRGNKLALIISTPGAPNGRFYSIQSHKTGFQDWWVRHIKHQELLDCGMVDPKWAENRRLQWGEDSEMFKNHVLGEFADTGDDHLIPLAWVEAAVERHHQWRAEGHPQQGGPLAQGIDVAGQGKDKTAVAFRDGRVIQKIEYRAKSDTMQTANGAMQKAASHPEIHIEADGMGVGVYDRCREMKRDEPERFAGVNISAIVAGSGTDHTDASGELRFADMRSYLWWRMRERLDPNSGEEIALPDDPDLIADLTTPKWEIRAGGKIKVESKAEIRKRLKRSTDSADSVILAFADDTTPLVSAHIRVSAYTGETAGGAFQRTFYDIPTPRQWPYALR